MTIIISAARAADQARDPEPTRLPPKAVSQHVLELPGRTLRFIATAGALHLTTQAGGQLADLAFTAYQIDSAGRPVTFVFNGGPGIASAWLQLGMMGPWRIPLDPHAQGPSAAPVPQPNAETWLDFTDLVFIDPPGTGYSRVVTSDSDARRRLWSVAGDVSVLAEAIRRWLDQNNRITSPKYVVGESYGGFRAPRLARILASEQGVGVAGLVLLSPLLDAHQESGIADPMAWADLLPTEVAIARTATRRITRADLADVEAYAISDYLSDMLRGEEDHDALDRLTSRVAALTGLDPARVRHARGRLDADVFQQLVQPNRVASVYDGTVTRADPTPRELASHYPDPILAGLAAPITSGMVAVYNEKLNWRPDAVYHLSSDAVFSAWDWGHGLSRPESLTALQAARSLDPHLRVLIAHGLFDLRTPYFATVRMLRLLPELDRVPPIDLKVYPGGHMFYLDDASRAALRDDAKAMFGQPDTAGGSH